MRLAAALLLALTLPAGAESWPICTGGNRAARHLSCVVDSDTIWARGIKYRFERIDGPEISSPACRQERAIGLMARARLQQLLRAGPVDLRPTGRIDGTGERVLANPTAGGRDVQAILLREGLALPYTPGGRRMRAAHWCGGAE